MLVGGVSLVVGYCVVDGVSQRISVRVQITPATFVQVCIGASLQFG